MVVTASRVRPLNLFQCSCHMLSLWSACRQARTQAPSCNVSLVQESSITDEVEAELRPTSAGSSHTPVLPSKKVRPPRDDSLPSPRQAAAASLSPGPGSAIMSTRSTLVQLRRGAGAQHARGGKQAPAPPKRTR